MITCPECHALINFLGPVFSKTWNLHQYNGHVTFRKTNICTISTIGPGPPTRHAQGITR